MTWHIALVGLLTLGATVRVTRLITDDRILEPLRTRLLNRATATAAAHRAAATDVKKSEKTKDEDRTKELARTAAGLARKARRAELAADFVHCPWCVSVWVAAAAVAAAFHYLTGQCPATYTNAQWFLYTTTVLSLSQITGVVAQAVDYAENHVYPPTP